MENISTLNSSALLRAMPDLPAGKNSIGLKDQCSARNLDFEDFHLKLEKSNM